MARLLALLCLLLATPALADRSLSQKDLACVLNRPNGAQAVATAEARLSSPGSVSVHVSATGVALAEAGEAIVELVAEAFAKVADGEEVVSLAEAEGVAAAKAVAEAYANVAIDLSSTAEDAEVCASGFSSASVTATAFASLIVDVLAQASNVVSFANASAAAEAISVVTASAFADADAFVCAEGIANAALLSESLSKGVAEAYIEVFAIAFAAVSGGSGVADIVIEVASDQLLATFADGKDTTEIEGNVLHGASTSSSSCSIGQNQCPSRFLACCSYKRTKCRCGITCRAEVAPLGEGSVYGFVLTEGATGGMKKGDTCFCPI